METSDDPLLPYLTYFKGAIAHFAGFAGDDPVAAMYRTVAIRLVDQLMVQCLHAKQYKLDCYAAMQPLLPTIERILGDVSELKAVCASADPDQFGRFIELAGKVQRELVVLDTAEAKSLCKFVIDIEAAFCAKTVAAVERLQAAGIDAKTSLIKPRNTRRIDEAAMLEFLRQEFPSETGLAIARSEFLSGGYSKFTACIDLANAKTLPEHLVLRGDASATYGGASVVDEFRLIKTLYEHGVCVPRPVALEESGSVFGSPFLLAERMPGTTIGHMFQLPGPNKAIGADIARKLAAIHKVPAAAFGDRVDNAHGKSSDKVRQWLDEGYRTWKTLNRPSSVFEAAFEWLRRNADLNDRAPRALVHGDYGLNNILIYDERASAILDWEFAHIGNPAYDLGYFYFMAESLMPWDDFLCAYGEGAAVPDPDQIDYSILFAATRLGVMVCQTDHVFTSGADPATTAFNLGGNFYEETIRRISWALGRVI